MTTPFATGLRRVRILGLPVDRCSRIEFRMFLRRALAAPSARRVVTLNPEIVLAARQDPRYAVTIRTADLVTVDGTGLALALRAMGHDVAGRITGTDVFEDLAALAVEEGRHVTFLLRADGLTSPPLLRAALTARWPALKYSVGVVDPTQPIDPALVRAIVDDAPTILVVNFGHPHQERWIAEHLDWFRTVRIAAGIGGALDYFAGAVPPPPQLVRRFGVEWAWRLLRQPRRWRRILRATIAFPAAVVQEFILRAITRRIPQRRHAGAQSTAMRHV